MNNLLEGLTLSADAAVDLHMHTTFSDGVWSAQELIEHLVTREFALVAVTDHDRVDKIAEIQELAATRGLPVLPGVEISTQWHGHLAHLLCYGFDPAQNALGTLTEKVARTQLENTYAVHEKLLQQGYRFPRQAEVLAMHGGQLFRPIDNATLLQAHGYAANQQQALQMIHEAGFYSVLADLAEAVEATHQSGGVSLIAHAGRKGGGFTFYTPEMLDQIRAELPLDGLEVYHPYHSPETVEMYLTYVKKYDLLYSTGSDAHGHASRMPMKYAARISQKLLERLGVTIQQS